MLTRRRTPLRGALTIILEIPSQKALLLAVVVLVVFVYLKIVGNREDARDAVRLHACNLFVHLVSDRSLQADVSILYDDVNRWDGAELVLAENIVAIDSR